MKYLNTIRYSNIYGEGNKSRKLHSTNMDQQCKGPFKGRLQDMWKFHQIENGARLRSVDGNGNVTGKNKDKIKIE